MMKIILSDRGRHQNWFTRYVSPDRVKGVYEREEFRHAEQKKSFPSIDALLLLPSMTFPRSTFIFFAPFGRTWPLLLLLLQPFLYTSAQHAPISPNKCFPPPLPRSLQKSISFFRLERGKKSLDNSVLGEEREGVASGIARLNERDAVLWRRERERE